MNNIGSSALRRISVLYRVLNQRTGLQLNVVNGSRQLRSYSTASTVTIGDITKPVTPAQSPQFVPQKYLGGELSQEALRHLRWMMQKDILGQDMFLIGRPGPLRRQLAMQYLELTGRELEYVSLSRDTTEADLKQRREIQGGTAKYFDQSAVRAAIEGRILILEGIEKAERNVLPVLNNLLENREMHLEDGRFLIPASRYDKLLKEHSRAELDRWNLVRVSEDFRVIALGLPVPRFAGNPLDPPLRSRFQARDVAPDSYKDQLSLLRAAAPSADPAALAQLLSCCHALLSPESQALALPDFPANNVLVCAQLMESHPSLSPYEAFCRLYPYRSFLGREGTRAVEDVLRTFNMLPAENESPSQAFVVDVTPSANEQTANVRISVDGRLSACMVPAGQTRQPSPTELVPTPGQDRLLAEMMQSMAVADVCLVGPRGCGKSATVRRLAAMLGYQVEPIVLYQDMTSRDLIQQRRTLPNGDTAWSYAPLVLAALEGRMAVLDGLHRVHASTLAVVHRLAQDRELQLHDGRRLVRHDRYRLAKERAGLTDAEMAASGVLPVHPSFRVVALAEPSARNGGAGAWLGAELLSVFVFHEMRPLALAEERLIVNTMFGLGAGGAMDSVLALTHLLRGSPDATLQQLAQSLSLRQLLRIARRMAAFPSDGAASAVHRACLDRFLPSLARDSLADAMSRAEIAEAPTPAASAPLECRVDGDTVTIGNTTAQRYQTDAQTKVPDILFYDIPQHVAALEWLLQDFELGEHLLLVGNQGVGKNKLADRLLQLLGRPREYIQLHRDTTVQTLTLQPTVRAGVVVYEDSPLVQAVKKGHVLVVDEADKAPTHVTCILKTLVESGEMILSDGRRIVPHSDPRAASKAAEIVPVHPDFRMIVLANRPGFPFLGNDFFGALGDLFSCHSVDNPSPESELALLRRYGPDVPEAVIARLVKAFGELRHLADQGLVQYPYSTREVVGIVKHLQRFQTEGVAGVVGNVLDFDRYSPEMGELLAKTLHKHGIPVGANPNNVGLAKEFPLPARQLAGRWSTDSSRRTQLPVAQRELRAKPPMALSTARFPLDKTEARGLVFSEMQAHWDLPAPETAVVSALAVTKDPEGNPLKDRIHVLTTNPLALFTSQPFEDSMGVVRLEGLLKPEYGTKPQYNAIALGGELSGKVLVHEETSNGLLLVDSVNGRASPLPLRSVLDSASSAIAQRLGSRSERRWTLRGADSQGNVFALYEAGGANIEVLTFGANTDGADTICTVELPFALKAVHLASPMRWLLEDSDDRKYLLSKELPSDACPSVLTPLADDSAQISLSPVTSCADRALEYDSLSSAVGEKVTAPNRLLGSDWVFAAVAVGFPDLDTDNQVYTWPRSQRAPPPLGAAVTLPDTAQIVRPISARSAPDSALPGDRANLAAALEVVDVLRGSVRFVPVPRARVVSPVAAWMYGTSEMPVLLAATSKEGLVSVDAGGCVRLWETGSLGLDKSLLVWRKMLGGDGNRLQLSVDRPSGKDVSAPKHGKEDAKNEPHVGGNTWAGGTGGRDTAGLGGKGGPYRLDAGHQVHQVPQEEKDAVPDHVKKAAREMGQRAFKQRLKEIQMSEYDAQLYHQFSDAVQKQVQALRVILGSLQAKAKERQWMRHQTSGELDDAKLIESLTGEKTIYRRRGEKEPELGQPQTKPKRLRVLVDVSGSMYRFNSYDGRLDREMEAVVMVMEAFEGHEARIRYDIVGHSGESHDLTFIESSTPPRNNKDRLNSVKTMHAHSQFCMSGDNTLEATKLAIRSLSKEDCDEAIVVVLSDANLERYGIPPEEFAKALTSDSRVNAYAIFIGSLGDQATRLTSKLPAGKSFVCLDLKDIPQIMQQIFSASVLNTR